MELFQIGAGHWPRASSYEVVDGFIRPARTARVSWYDPLADYREAAAKRGWRKWPPYQALVSLVQDWELPPVWRPTLSPEQEAALTAWCVEHGLLGLALHDALSVTFAARWGSSIDATTGGVRRIQTRLFRRGGAWFGHYTEHTGSVPPGDLGALVSSDDSYGFEAPGAVWWEQQARWMGNPPTTRPLQSWRRFFPSVPPAEAETYAYPTLNEPRFWRLYAEPVWDFIWEAQRFAELLTIFADTPWQESDWTDGDWDRIDRANAAFNAMLATVTPQLALLPSDDASGTVSRTQRWAAPSLLTGYALMALQDLSGPARVQRCERCHAPFLTTAWQGKFCSDRCRGTVKKREQRQKRRSVVASEL